MGIPKFSEITTLSNQQIAEEIIQTENQLVNIHITNVNRRNFNPKQLRNLKHRLAQLKTLLTIRLKEHDDKEKTIIDRLIEK